MVNIKKNLVPESKYSIKCPYSMTPIGITVHNTANDASAKNEINYMINNDNQVSYHYAVDDIEIIQGIPEDRNAWHASDGANGIGNRKTIAIEICYSKSGGDRFIKAEQNAALLIADILKRYGWGIDKVKRHNDYATNKKYCPHRTMDMGWDRFLNMVSENLNGSNQSIVEQSKNAKFSVGNRVKINAPYKKYIADDVQIQYGIYQIRENTLAGGNEAFTWKENGIPESCDDLTDVNGNKRIDSDTVHTKKGDYFVFNRIFTVKKIANDKGQIYLLLDFDNNSKHQFWVIQDRCYLV